MKVHSTITLDRVMEAVQEDDNLGLCIHCGADAFGVEPDARGYECEECGEPGVYGADDLLLMIA